MKKQNNLCFRLQNAFLSLHKSDASMTQRVTKGLRFKFSSEMLTQRKANDALSANVLYIWKLNQMLSLSSWR